jgi:hypothetical protein
VRALFIRAPWIAEHGSAVEILARVGEPPRAVAAREGAILAAAFHTELGGDDRVHALFLESAREFAGRDGTHGGVTDGRGDVSKDVLPARVRARARAQHP